jgi:hypothetical protein
VWINGAFTKTGGTIDGTNSAQTGKVAYVYYQKYNTYMKRDTAAGPGDNPGSRIGGRTGGWEDVQTLTGVSKNIPAAEIDRENPFNGYWVQVGSYTDINAAQDRWRELYRAGCADTEIFSKTINGITYYRVRVGHYQSQDKANYCRSLFARINGFEKSTVLWLDPATHP